MQTEKNASLAGKARGLLLDRDGVINVDHGYVSTRDRFDFIPGLFPFLRAAQDRGWMLAILTNQSGVARGKYTAADHDALMRWVLAELAQAGIAIALTLASFTHPTEGSGAYRRDSFWRKPNPGMVLEALQRLRLDPARSAFLGDRDSDMAAAQAGGIGTCLWLGGLAVAPAGTVAVADYAAALRHL